ncbi:MAG: T9SS type A sorting domain-containing protein [Bacteroidales bacterium]|nr:T9SS type A sorting domain-containing protein [Bacteroidales bacterium]
MSQVNIYDITGKLMISEKTLSSNLNIDVTKLPKGMYIIKLSDGTSVVSKKIMK